jgi:hypothetical protein
MPYAQLHIDPLRGTLREVRRSWLFPGFQVIEESRRSLRAFSHVRVVERIQPNGRVDWAGQHGGVHLRADGLRPKQFGSRERTQGCAVARVDRGGFGP